MRSLFFPTRAREATAQSLAASGALGAYGVDPVDGDRGYTLLGQSAQDQPRWTTEKARAYSIDAYRTNPMGRAIIDTYTSFAIGDSGVAPQCDDAMTLDVVNEYWNDPRNRLSEMQSLLCRDWMINGELVWEFLVGPTTGITRYVPVSPTRVIGVELDRGNPLWHKSIHLREPDSSTTELSVATINDFTGLREGECGFFPSWRTLITDRRGTPFLSAVLDDLQAYAQVLSNLVDRTALARYLALTCEVTGADQDQLDEMVKERGGRHVPRSGSVEFHNEKVKWGSISVSSGSFEDTNTALSVLTNVASGSGLAKTWLAETEGANRATSMSMAEPVRRRVGGVQSQWLHIQTELARFAVDQAVAAGRLPKQVTTRNAAGDEVQVSPSSLVRVAGPEIAPANAEITSTVMLNLSTAINAAITGGFMTPEAGALAIQKGWEQIVGRPFPQSLAPKPGKSIELAADATAEEIEAAQSEGRLFLVS